jgi:hypothetical protein
LEKKDETASGLAFAHRNQNDAGRAARPCGDNRLMLPIDFARALTAWRRVFR